MHTSRRLIATVALGGTTMLVANRLLTPAFAADEETPAEAVEAFRMAMMTNDDAAFNTLCASKMSYGHSGGKIQTKEEFIADATGRKSNWKTLGFANITNTVAGMNAISRFTLTGENENDGKVTPVNIGVLMVWQKQQNSWKLLARQGFKV
jgi:hypothetical protein